jgi:outer membrane protein OmpU
VDKGKNMNIIKKIGLTALGTSLVASSAFAGELSVSGGAGYTYSSETGTGTARGSEAIGYNHHITIGGSTELDNGWTVSTNMVIEPSLALSTSSVKVTMGSMGSVVVGSGYGGIGANFDDVTPRAYEENHDGMTTSTAIDNIGANLDNGQILYTAPAMDMSGYSLTLMGEFAPTGNDTTVYDGGTATASGFGTGMGVGAVLSGNGLTAGAYVNEIEASNISTTRDASTATAYVNYAYGPVTLGYQEGWIDRGVIGASELATAAKTVAAATGDFDIKKMSIAFAVNDDLSVSWGRLEETYDSQSHNSLTTYGNVTMESDSFQVSYSMGAMSLAAYHTSTENADWAEGVAEEDINEIALNFAF